MNFKQCGELIQTEQNEISFKRYYEYQLESL